MYSRKWTVTGESTTERVERCDSGLQASQVIVKEVIATLLSFHQEKSSLKDRFLL
jgi:hypothetical protein